MPIKRFLCLALAVVLLCLPVLATETDSTSTAVETAQEYVPEAKAAFVVDRTTGTVLYAYEADTRLYPASLTKLLTALVVLEQGQLTDTITMTSSALASMEYNASVAGLAVGESYTTEQVLYCMLLPSGNDAAALLAEHYGGSLEGFALLMNEKAQALGCTDSHFVNPHGLHNEEHYSTARDMATIFLAFLEQEELVTILSSREYVMAEATDEEDPWTVYCTNVFISDRVLPDLLDERVICGKTGFTNAAGRCLAVLSRQDDMELVSILLGAEKEGDWFDGRFNHFIETRNLLDHLYSTYAITTLVEAGEACETLITADGLCPVETSAVSTVRAVLPLDWDPEQLLRVVAVSETLLAPVEAGSEAGTLELWYGDRCLGETPLLAAQDVPLPTEPATEPEPVTEPTQAVQTQPATTETPQPEEQPLPSAVWVALGVLALAAAMALVRRK